MVTYDNEFETKDKIEPTLDFCFVSLHSGARNVTKCQKSRGIQDSTKCDESICISPSVGS